MHHWQVASIRRNRQNGGAEDIQSNRPGTAIRSCFTRLACQVMEPAAPRTGLTPRLPRLDNSLHQRVHLPIIEPEQAFDVPRQVGQLPHLAHQVIPSPVDGGQYYRVPGLALSRAA